MGRVSFGIIYKVTNKINQKVYIGQTTKKLSRRWSDHCSKKNKSCKALHNSIQKYGKHNFTCEPILTCFNRDDLNLFETYFIKYYKSFSKLGYNLSRGGYFVPGYERRTSVIAYNYQTGEELFINCINSDSAKFNFDPRSVHRCLKGEYTSHKNCVFIKANEYSIEQINQLIDTDINRKLKLKKKNATSQYRGVVRDKDKFTTYFSKNGKTICLGSFTDEQAAFAVYKAAFMEKYYRSHSRY